MQIMHQPGRVYRPVSNPAGDSPTADSVGSLSRSNSAETSGMESKNRYFMYLTITTILKDLRTFSRHSSPIPPLSLPIWTPTKLLLSCSERGGFRQSVEFPSALWTAILFSSELSLSEKGTRYSSSLYLAALLKCRPHSQMLQRACSVTAIYLYASGICAEIQTQFMQNTQNDEWPLCIYLTYTTNNPFTIYPCNIHMDTLKPYMSVCNMNSGTHSRQNGSHTSGHYPASSLWPYR